MKTDLITVYMPTKNRLSLLKRAISSVLNQSYQHFELIIVDDASTDGTWEYINLLSNQNSKVKIFRQDRSQGACVARNIAINNAQGKYITGLDDDDEFTPHRLNALLSAYDPKWSFVCNGFSWHYGYKEKLIDTKSKVITLKDQLNYNYGTNQVFTETQKLKEIGGFDPHFPACQDYDTWTRLIIEFGDAKRAPGYSYILHQGHEGPRITIKSNKYNGYNLFFDKYINYMTPSNQINQKFLQRMASQENYSVIELLHDIPSGYVQRKLRYFVARKMPLLSSLRMKWLKR